jgi:hypothetical protein
MRHDSHDWLFKVVPVFIIVVWALTLAGIVAAVIVAATQGPAVIDWLTQHGIKGICCGTGGCTP